MKVSDLDFDLPQSSIALAPHSPRDACRLLVAERETGSFFHHQFFDLPSFLDAGDLLILNNTKVFPARLVASKSTGGSLEILLVREIEPGAWEVLSKGKYTGEVEVPGGLCGNMTEGKLLRFPCSGDELSCFLWEHGLMPLPPYIKRKPCHEDREWYQTVFCRKTGSIAAPTAGLHFTERLLTRLEEKGVRIRYLTLHVGVGTFRPIHVDEVDDHRMESEYFEFEESLVEEMKRTRRAGRRVLTVGTTSTRAIEGFLSGRYTGAGAEMRRTGDTVISPGLRNTAPPCQTTICGYTDIFIRPGHAFLGIDSLVTNFHLPRSTPLMLTAAFCGTKNLMHAYREAVACGYSFFSYGDAMLIL